MTKKYKHFNFLFIIFSIFFGGYSIAQTGKLKGSIKDAKTNEAAIGATIKITNTSYAVSSDVEGNFEFTSIPAGNFTVSISYIGFNTKEIQNIRIEADKTTIINTTLDESTNMLEQIVVKAQRMTGTEVAVISEIKKIQNIAVGISSQQISKSQDRDASQVIRRVSGVSIFDDRFIVIRGLNERYNTVLLNDIITPSTEVDVKSFSFDLIPSSAIDRMMVYKSPSADLPGDIAGGAVKIFTKTVPDGNQLNFGFNIGYRTNVTAQKVLDHKGSSGDAFGFGAGDKQLPGNFVSTKSVLNFASSDQVINKFKGLEPFYDLSTKQVNPDIRANLNFSRRIFIGNKEITNISYINYSNTNNNQQIAQNRFFFDGKVQNDFLDNSYQNNVRLGVLSNWAFIINPKNKIEFRNIFNQLATKETISRTGNLYENNLEIFNQSFRYEQKSIFSSQLSGTHELSQKSRLNWISGLGYTIRKEPDFRRFTSSRELGSTGLFNMNLQQFESPTLQQAARFYSNMDEFVFTGSINHERVLNKKYNDNPELNKTLKSGIYSEYKDRYFKARWFGVVNPNRVSNELLSLDPKQFFNIDNLAANKVFYAEGTNNDDKYTAQNFLAAGYSSLFLPFNEKFNVTMGIRLEYNQQMLQSRERGGGAKVEVNNPIFSPLPSINGAYKFNEKNIIRFGAGSTVNRPEFRELAPFTYYDFLFDVSRRGNKDIKIAKIQNLDVRYEFYPTGNEIITIGGFYKNFKDPIEAAIFYNGSTVAFTVANSQSAYATGVEFEIRKNITKNITALLNTSLIKSDVTVSGLSTSNRFLQGQSPYLINAAIFYNNPKSGLQANVLYNVIGERIYVIGDNVLSSNVFEMPRHVIDCNITKTVGKIEVKAGVQDALNQAFRLIQDTDRNNKITDTDGIFQKYKRGSNYFIGVNYKF